MVRPRVQRRDLTAALQLLNGKESNRDGRGKLINREMTSAVKFLDRVEHWPHRALSRIEVVEVLDRMSDSTGCKFRHSELQLKMHDVIIIGAGPAGLSTAFWCDELGLDTLVLEQAEQIGGQLHRVYNPIENYLGLKTRNGARTTRTFYERC